MSSISVGQANQFFNAFEKAGGTAADLTALGQSREKMKEVLKVARKAKHIVVIGRPPRSPFDSYQVVKHEGEGKGAVEIELRSDDNLYVDGKLVSLSLSEEQKGDKQIIGHELRQELESGEQVLLNSNVLDYLYDHPELFPEHWKNDESGDSRYIFFWGSIFRHLMNGGLYACYLYWSGGDLRRDYYWLDHDWDRHNPSACVAA